MTHLLSNNNINYKMKFSVKTVMKTQKLQNLSVTIYYSKYKCDT